MRRLPAVILALAVSVAWAGSTITTTPGPWDLYQSTTRKGSYTSEAACATAAGTFGVGSYTCRTSTAVSVSTSGAPSGAATYSTSFNLTENPISEGGNWTNGKHVGILWNDIRTLNGNAIGSGLASNTYHDNLAHLNGFQANQWAQGVVYRDPNYGTTHELELLLRFQITPNNARGYEIMWSIGGLFNLVRWNGPDGNFTVIPWRTWVWPQPGEPKTGDVLRVEMVGNTITVKKNGAIIATAVDSTWTTGNPGMGVFVRSGDLTKYGWSSFSAGSL